MADVSLIIDDSCPLVHVFREHWRDVHHKDPPTTVDGRLLTEFIPNDFLNRFCDVAEQWEMAGKFSIVPAPAARGDIVRGISGFPVAETKDWVETAERRLGARFDFCPEMVTHNLVLDLETGQTLPVDENTWSQSQTRETLTPYLTHALRLLNEAGVDATGFTSPWVFGIQVEPEYIAAMLAAQCAVYGRDFSWYFLHMNWSEGPQRPWLAAPGLVSVPATVRDHWWATIDSPRTDQEFITGLAANVMADVESVIERGGVPVFCTHWQSLWSNGTEAGLAVLDEVGRRVAAAGHRWRSMMELAQAAAGS
jgi:hypothetical protein